MGEISINGYGLSTLCRLCLSRGVTVLDIFDYSSEMRDNLANVIMKCAPVQVINNEVLVHVMSYFVSKYCFCSLRYKST